MTVINTNVGALTARTYAVKATSNTETAMERLSSGLRINSAADDAAGLAVANKMESQLRGMNMAIRNSQDGISLVQTAEAAMGEISNMTIRMRELAVQMNNGVYTDSDRANAQLEVTALLQEIDKISSNAAFNQVKILDGTYSKDIRAGNTNPEIINVKIDRMNTDSLGGTNLAGTESAATAANSSAVNSSANTTVDVTAANSVTIQASSFNSAMTQFTAANSGGTYALTGSDASDFSIDASTGEITSNGAVSYNTTTGSSNTKSLTVTYTSGANTFTDQLSVNVANNTSDAVVKASSTNLTTSESANVSFRSVDSDNATDGQLSNSMQSFVTADTGTGTFSLSGTDAAQFTIDATTGVVTAALDFENKLDDGSDNTYDFNVVYTSSTGDSFTETVALSVTDSTEEMDTISSVTFTGHLSALDAGSTISVVADSQTVTATLNADDAAFSVTDAVALLNAANDARGANAARGTFAEGSVANTIEFTYSDSVGDFSGTRVTAVTVSDFDQAAADTTTAGISLANAAVDAVASTTTYSGLSGNLNVAEAGDSFEIILNGTTTLSASVAAGTNAGDFSVQDLADAFTAANNALGTPETVTFSTDGANLVATHNTAGTSYTFQSTLSFVDGGTTATVGTSSATAAVTAEAQIMDFDITATGSLATAETAYDTDTGDQDYFIEMTIDGTAYKSSLITNGGSGTADVDATDYRDALNANSDFAALFTATANDIAEVITVDVAGSVAASAAVGDVIRFSDGTNNVNAAALSGTVTDESIAAALQTAIDADANFSATVDGTVITVTLAAAGAASNTYAVTNTTNAGNVASTNTITQTGIDGTDNLRITANDTGTANAGVFTNVGFRFEDEDTGSSATTNNGVTSLANTGATNNETNGRDNSATGNNKDAAATNTLNGNFGARDNDASFVNGAKNTITLQEANVVKFGTDAMSSSMQTYMATQGQTGGTFSLSGADVEFFEVNANSGLVQNKQNMDFETKQSYAISVTYTDKNGQTFTDEVTLNLTDNTADNVQHIADVDLSTQGGAASAISILDSAINQISGSQAKLGAIQNRLEHNIDNLSMASMLTETSRGRIVDADFARETSELSKQQILAQAATSMLAQANQSKQGVLALLQ